MKAKRKMPEMEENVLSDPAFRKILEAIDARFLLLGEEGLPVDFRDGLLAGQQSMSKRLEEH